VGFELIVFDCDGVVADSEVLACSCLRDVLAEYGVPVTMEDIFDRFLGRSFAAVAGYYREATGESLPDRFTAAYRQRLFSAFAASLKPVPHVATALGRLGMPFCLASSSDRERIALTLAVTGLSGHFGERVFNAAMVANGKPAPDLFLLAAERMSARPERTLVVEDTVSGVRAGKAAGMTVWGFTGGSHCAGRDFGGMLENAGADRVFASMADFRPQ
jgi:HAD superfamily hydrolase (TIGR01509 family)